MKPNYTHPTLLSFLLFFTLKLFGQPGCDSPTLAQYCNQTCISCSGIDGYTNRLIMTEIGQPLPDFCTEWLLNQNYLGFMAGTTFLELEIEVFDCDKCCGMEAAIYKSTGCNQFTLVSDSCVTAIGFNKSYVFKNSVPFEEGGCYYLVFDSDGGSDCAFNINVLAGSTLPPNWTDSGVVTGPTEICAGLPATYHIPGLPCNRLHKWWLDGNEIASGQQAVELTFPAAGDYELCSQAFGICHEIPPTCITIHVPAVPTLEKPLECCAGDTITVDGLKFHTAGTFPHVYKTPLGCDSIVNYVVEILPVVTTNLSATICFGKTYPFLGDILTTAGLYQKILANPKTGCDSIVKLDLKIRPEAKSDLPMTICFGETFTLGGQTFSNSGKFPVVFQTAFGCDSTVTLDLKILPEAKSDLPKTLCFGETFTLGGQTFSTPGKFPVVFQTAFGCDSTVTLDLKILPEAKSDRAETICFGETFSLGGQTFSNSGNYQVKFLTPFGCDSTVNLTLKILPAAISSRTETICFGEKFTLGGQTFSKTGK